jgi:ferritin
MRIIENVRELEEPKKKKEILDSELIDLFVEQLKHELKNQNIYYSIAAYFNTKGLYKLVSYWRARANEEYKHHLWCLNYLLENNVDFVYPEIDAVELDIKDPVDAFQLSYDLELETTESIYKIYDKAVELKDACTIAFLLGNGSVEGKLVPEQSEEQKLSLDVLKLASMDTDWITIQDTIMTRYNE